MKCMKRINGQDFIHAYIYMECGSAIADQFADMAFRDDHNPAAVKEIIHCLEHLATRCNVPHVKDTATYLLADLQEEDI